MILLVLGDFECFGDVFSRAGAHQKTSFSFCFGTSVFFSAFFGFLDSWIRCILGFLDSWICVILGILDFCDSLIFGFTKCWRFLQSALESVGKSYKV